MKQMKKKEYKTVIFTQELIKMSKKDDDFLANCHIIDGVFYKEGKLVAVKCYKGKATPVLVCTPMGRNKVYLTYQAYEKQNEN